MLSKRPVLWIVAVIVAGVSVVFAYLYVSHYPFELRPPSIRTLQETASPDGRFVATVFSVEGGATTGVAGSVLVRKSGEPLDPPKVGRILFGLDGSLEVTIEWGAASHLRVVHGKGRIVVQEYTFQDITIDYVER
jgi:hypothetical protein